MTITTRHPGLRTTAAAPRSTTDLRTRVDARLDTFIAARSALLLEVSPDLGPVADEVRQMAHGGKRLRAAFCWWGWRGASDGSGDDAALTAAAALELFHLAALVHDDVMDHSDVRRGRPAAHRAFETHHDVDGLRGSAADFGQGSAILLGDLCLTWSDELLASCEVDRSTADRARRVYDRMRTQVIAGQYLDMLEQARPSTEAAAVRTVLRYKSAKYTVEHPLLLGGALAGAGPDVLESYSAFGLPLGEAFQLRDDVLGVFGDPARTGKPAGDDIREGKKTLLVLAALERLEGASLRLLEESLGDRTIDDARVDEVRAALVGCGALTVVEDRIAALTDDALVGLHGSPVEVDVKTALAALAADVTVRDA